MSRRPRRSRAAQLARMAAPAAPERRSAENPAEPLDAGLFDDGRLSAAGIRVSPQTALRVGAVWRAVNLIANDVGKLPIKVYKREGEGQRSEQRRHPAWRLLTRRPSAELTPIHLKRTITAHALLRGGGYGYISRSAAGELREIVPLPPQPETVPVRENGRLWYVTQLANGERRRLDPRNVLHIRGLGFDGLCGYSAVEYGAGAFGLALAGEEYGGRFFANDGTPNLVLEVPAFLKPEERRAIKGEWAKMHQGLSNSHKVALLQGGISAKAVGISAKDAQLLELRQFQLLDIANWFGIPPYKLGASVNVSYKSLEQENQNYLDQAMDPWLVTWEEELTAKLLTDEEQADGYYLEYDRNALVRADMATRWGIYDRSVNGGLLTLNEARGRENLPPLPGGDQLRIPVNAVQAPDSDSDDDSEEPDDAA